MRNIKSDYPNAQPAYPPGLIKRTSSRLGRILKTITIEPAVFLISFSTNMDDVTLSQMTLYKSCSNDFPQYDNETCLNLVNDTEANSAVQKEVNQFRVYQTLVSSLFPIFFSFYLGAWCDLFGRKLLFFIYLMSRCVEQCVVIISAVYLESKKEYLLFQNIPAAISGGYGVWILAMNAFIADVTANPNDLAFRYGMLHLATSLGRPVAAPVGAYLFQTGGYVCVFSTSLCGTALGAAFLFWRIRSFKWNPPKKEGAIRTISKSAFSLSHISDCINTTFKKREGPNRKYILICMVMILMNVFVYIGEMVMDYNYVRTRYGWQVAEYSVYSSVISGASLIGQAIVIPFVGYMKISESLVMIFLYVSFISRYVIKGFAEYSWMYYLGGLVDIIGSYTFSIIKALSVLCVSNTELGKINAVLSALENVLPIVAIQGYSYIWGLTDETYPGTIFFVSAGICCLNLACSIYVHLSLRGKRMAEVTKEGAKRFSEEELKEMNRMEDRKLNPDTFELTFI